MPSEYNQGSLQADLAAIEHALATDDQATIAAAAQRCRTLINSAGAVGTVVQGARGRLQTLLERCQSELAAGQ
jgi:hypothetical protein